MRAPRRRFLRLAAGAAALPAALHSAWAQPYPARPVHLVVPLPAGSATDVSARLLGQALSERLGQPFVIENRPGASTNIGTEVVVRAPADGYTLLATSTINVTNTSLYPNLTFNFIRDIAPVALIGDIAFVLAINPSVPAKMISELVAYARANPGKITMASAGTGSANHVFGALFEMMTAVSFVHVPYRSSYIPDLLSGQVDLVFTTIAQVIEHIRGGRLRALAVTSATRAQTLPDVPTVGESVPGYDASGWLGMGAPAGTPSGIIATLNRLLGAIIAEPNVKKRLVGAGIDPRAMTPAELGKFTVEQTEKWAKVIDAAKIKVE
ncbi:MAG: MFS transporter [Proteobacteria bacterium]|nr:MAG: MFS transporter [Pseudomonadota bacterium]